MRSAYFFYIRNYRSDAFLKTLAQDSEALLVGDFSRLRSLFRQDRSSGRAHRKRQVDLVRGRSASIDLDYRICPVIDLGSGRVLHPVSIVFSTLLAIAFAVFLGFKVAGGIGQRSVFYNGHPLFFPALVFARLRGHRILTDLGDVLHLLDNRNSLSRSIEIRFLRWSTTIVCVTRVFRNHLVDTLGFDAKRIQVLSAAVPEAFAKAFDENHNRVARNHLRSRIGAAESALVLGYAGDRWFRSVEGKRKIDIQGVDFLCRAVARLNRLGRETHLVLMGVADTHSDLREFSADPLGPRFHFMGRYTQLDDHHRLCLGGVDALCLPSAGSKIYHLYDRFKMYEYMAAGKTIIAADLQINREILPADSVFYPESDLEEMAQTILRAADEGLADFIPDSNRRIRERYTWEQRLNDGSITKILDGENVERD